MKETRKQKLRKKEAKRRTALERKFAVGERLLDLLGVKSLFCPLDWMSKADLVTLIYPGLDVEISDDAKQDPELEELKSELERMIERQVHFTLDDREVEISLNDVCRGLLVMQSLVKYICNNLHSFAFTVPAETIARLKQAKKQVVHFRENHFRKVYSRLYAQLDDIVDRCYRIDEKIIWYRFERNSKYPDREVRRIRLARKPQLPVTLSVSEGRRRAYPVVSTRRNAEPQQLKWNPARLSIGEEDRDLPVFVGEHALSRLRERIPILIDVNPLNFMLHDALVEPKLRPTEGDDGFLVEAGPPGRNLGYFVAEIHDDFVFVRTFLFLTMQGTPEARCLRHKLGLSRKDIEYYRLDHLFTLAWSDLGDDPALRGALAECGCDYLLDFSTPTRPLSWLKRYREPLRHELGLPVGSEPGDDQIPDRASHIEIGSMIEYCQKRLKVSQGWTL